MLCLKIHVKKLLIIYYHEYNQNRLNKRFSPKCVGNWKQSDEPSALMVLRNMHKVIREHHLVPEHVETRSLYCPDKPGVEQVGQGFFLGCVFLKRRLSLGELQEV